MTVDFTKSASEQDLVLLNTDQSENSAPTLVEKFVIRLPSGLRDQIKQLSEQNRRSMNSEIIMVLETYIRQQFLDQMAETHADSSFVPGARKKEEVLKTMLESLPAEKQDALFELLRN